MFRRIDASSSPLSSPFSASASSTALSHRVHRVARTVALFALALVSAAHAQTDPPGRVGRISVADGAVQLFPAQRDGRESVTIDNQREPLRNWPLTSGDLLSVGDAARADISVGSTRIRMAPRSQLAVTRIDDEVMQLTVLDGSIALSLRTPENVRGTAIQAGEVLMRPQGPGLFRIDVQADRVAATAWREGMSVEGRRSIINLRSGQRLQLDPLGTEWRLTAPESDRFAAWAMTDDGAVVAQAPVSPEMTGQEDLARYGDWQSSEEWGPVWMPRQVAADWAPYEQGRWAWVAPWGWTWVDAAPWGFAPFHYGRWVQWRQRWVWAPGSYEARPAYAPALVSWGGPMDHRRPPPNWSMLSPREAYLPPFAVTPGYGHRVNRPHVPEGTVSQRSWSPDHTNARPIYPGARQDPPAQEPRWSGAPAWPGQRQEPPRATPMPTPTPEGRWQDRPGQDRPVQEDQRRRISPMPGQGLPPVAAPQIVVPAPQNIGRPSREPMPNGPTWTSNLPQTAPPTMPSPPTPQVQAPRPMERPVEDLRRRMPEAPRMPTPAPAAPPAVAAPTAPQVTAPPAAAPSRRQQPDAPKPDERRRDRAVL